MKIVYDIKKTEDEILVYNGDTSKKTWNSDTNKLILSENLHALKILLYDYNLRNKIDLIYIDPPFATNSVFKMDDQRSNSVSMPQNGNVAYFDNLVGDEYLEFIRERLIVARELLSDCGSIYLHIDYKIGHYVKILMDEIFGIKNFKNDITRIKCNPKNFSRKAYGNVKDMILFYTKSQNNIWNEPVNEYSESDIQRLFKKIDKNGRRYTTVPLHAPGETINGKTGEKFNGILPPSGRHWRCTPEELNHLEMQGLIEWSANNVPRKIIYADERKGKKTQDIWEFKDSQTLLYPTEKNINLLKNIINASSNEDSIILDFFCGSGTTLLAADVLGRKWIGIDNSAEAIKIVQKRLSENLTLFSRDVDFITFCNDDISACMDVKGAGTLAPALPKKSF